ncbi:MAG TPA: acetyl-CoA hydrolase/transferase C-terminal domain-containing protein, partial [Polyangiaceae bacterium]
LVAKRGEKFSLSCNPDVTLDLLDRIAAVGKQKPLVIGVVHPDLPFLGGDAEVSGDLFDAILDTTGEEQPLFALPREPVDFAGHAIGLHASTLVKDGGTLQIGIGALSDALVAGLVLRHEKNEDYVAALAALGRPNVGTETLVEKVGGSTPFGEGLYGASEMVMDGFMHLRKAGILKRIVHDELLSPEPPTGATKNGHYLKGAFFLGSKELYAWLRELQGDDWNGLFMSRVSDVNQLYGGREQLDAAQRKDARFFNICMMATALGAAVSDGLEDGRVVSGVGGQYNFVAMAHAIEGGRSILLFRSTRTVGDRTESNVRFAYGHVTIPRHLRDVFVTEYGVADLRGKSDEDCTKAMLAISDARFQDEIVRAAIRGKKLPKDFVVPDAWKQNTPEALEAKMKPLAARGFFPTFPFGSDFTPVEERLLPALAWLQKTVKSEEWGTIAGAAMFPPKNAEIDACIERLGLAAPKTMKERVLARVVRGALARTTSK